MWIAPVMSGIAAVLSLVTVIIVARMNTSHEQRKWLREERVRAAVDLKLAVSKLRVAHSRPEPGDDPAATAKRFDFSEVNAAMGRMDIIGCQQTVANVQLLRGRLREFVQAGANGGDEWRAKRTSLDDTVNDIIQLVRKDVL
ncbi:hypothetical protein GCM10022254_33090 [Actinomadura meridiana]|uniref:Secreted protein n=1 Tax=Actinomadura meridiana TaxID=559626 RepID=A0ABP8C3M2_9ACTN